MDFRKEANDQWFHVSPLVSADCAVFNEENRLLLIKRADNLLWALPGGLVEIGETPSAAAAREAYEECGAVVEPYSLLACYDSRLLETDTPYQVLHMVYIAKLVDSRHLATSNEAKNFGWFDSPESLAISPGHAVRINDAFRWRQGVLVEQPFC